MAPLPSKSTRCSSRSFEVLAKPRGSKVDDPVQRTRFLEQMPRPGTITRSTAPRMCFMAARFSSMTGSSRPPTISKVGARTRSSASAPARSGRPPRETTAATGGSGDAAASSAAPAPVLAPKYPSVSPRVSGCCPAQRAAAIRRDDSRAISNTLARTFSSSTVNRSMRSVASPSRLRPSATCVLRGLCRPLPLPWAKMTSPRAPSGTPRRPFSSNGASNGAMVTASEPFATGLDILSPRMALGPGKACAARLP